VRDVGLRKEGDAIVRSLTALCDSLGIMSAVEGVEREAQFRILSDEDCTEVQGSLFGGYVTADEVQALYQAWPLPPQRLPGDSGRMGLHPR